MDSWRLCDDRRKVDQVGGLSRSSLSIPIQLPSVFVLPGRRGSYKS